MFDFGCRPDCAERTPYCHSTCERYLSRKAEYNRLKAAQEADRDVNDYVSTLVTKSMNNAAKYKQKRPNNGKY